ncbi:MAG: DUF6624 domain-containing protein [Bacteroidales bacterium]|jgi:hypothetical protein
MKKTSLIKTSFYLFICFMLFSINLNSQTTAECAVIKEQLDSIWNADQYSRVLRQLVQNQHGGNSQEMRELQEDMKIQDAQNLEIVTEILDKYGWIGSDRIGEQANVVFYLVLQKADTDVKEKYLPLLRDAVANGDALPNHLALIEDVVALSKGQKQIYGTQVVFDQELNRFYVRPLQDPDNVDFRRMMISLPPMDTYLNSWNMRWDVEEYKSNLPLIIERDKILLEKASKQIN